MKIRTTFIAIALACSTTLLAGPLHAAERVLASSEVINAKGYPLKIGDGIQARLINVTNQKKPTQGCNVDINAFQKINFQKYKWQKKGKAASATIDLKVTISGGDIICDGSGKGCRVTVEVPSVSASAARYLGIK